MGPETKDKPGHVQDDNWLPGGLSKGEVRDMEARAIAGADQDEAAKREARKWSGKFDGQLPLDSAGGDAPSNPDSGLTSQPKREYTALDAHNRRMNKVNEETNPFSALKGRITKKRTITGVVVGGIIGGGFFGFSLIQGPAQVIQLAEWLKTPSFGNEKNSSIRVSQAYRYWKSGDIGETRVSGLGSSVFRQTMENLERSGITYDRDPNTGKVRSQTIDTSQNSQLRGKSIDEVKGILAREYGLPESRFQQIGMGAAGSGFKVATNLRDMNIGAERRLHFKTLEFFNDNTGLRHLGDGSIVNAMQKRVVAKFFHIPSLWTPLQRAVANQANKYSTKAERRAAEKERVNNKINPVTERFSAARASLRERLSGRVGTALSRTLLTTGGMCIVRDSADDAAELNRGIAVASAAQAADKKSIGSQVKSNKNVSLSVVGAVIDSFTDPDTGESIWGSKPLKSLGDPRNTKGVDLPYEYKQAFKPGSTAKDIKDTLGGGFFGSIACSTPGQIAQGAFSFIQLLAGPITGGVSWAAFAAQQGPKMAATAGVVYLLQQKLTALLANDTVMPSPLSGHIGGGLLAYGSMELENIAGRGSGGIPLNPTESAALRQEQFQESQREFRNKGTFAKLFDINDYRTPVGQLATSISPDISRNIANAATIVTQIPSMLGSTFSIFIPSAHAEEEYEWPMDIVGVPSEIINDPNLENPYENAAVLASILDSSSGQGYIDKAKKCFGVEISKGSEGWDAITQEEVNPNSEEYVSANCDDISDYNWKRTLLFVFDVKTLTAAACYQGDDDACNKLNVSTGDGTGASDSGITGEGATRIVEVAEQEFAKNGNKVLETCGANCGPEVQKYTGGASGPNAPWCAWFVSWVYREAGYEFKDPPAGSDGNIPSVANLIRWFQQHGIQFDANGTQFDANNREIGSGYKPQPGDVIMYDDSVHTGIVVKVNGDEIETIEGNTSSDNNFNANGGTVGRKNFNYKTSARHLDFGRLKEF